MRSPVATASGTGTPRRTAAQGRRSRRGRRVWPSRIERRGQPVQQGEPEVPLQVDGDRAARDTGEVTDCDGSIDGGRMMKDDPGSRAPCLLCSRSRLSSVMTEESRSAAARLVAQGGSRPGAPRAPGACQSEPYLTASSLPKSLAGGTGRSRRRRCGRLRKPGTPGLEWPRRTGGH